MIWKVQRAVWSIFSLNGSNRCNSPVAILLIPFNSSWRVDTDGIVQGCFLWGDFCRGLSILPGCLWTHGHPHRRKKSVRTLCLGLYANQKSLNFCWSRQTFNHQPISKKPGTITCTSVFVTEFIKKQFPWLLSSSYQTRLTRSFSDILILNTDQAKIWMKKLQMSQFGDMDSGSRERYRTKQVLTSISTYIHRHHLKNSSLPSTATILQTQPYT